MSHTPPVPAANQSPYPLKEAPHPPTPPRTSRSSAAAAPGQSSGKLPWFALLGAGAIAVIGGTLLMRRR